MIDNDDEDDEPMIVVPPSTPPAPVSDARSAKDALFAALEGCERGAKVDNRAAIEDAIVALEVVAPPASDMKTNTPGKWRLVYTSNSELVPLLFVGQLPYVEVLDIYQNIDVNESEGVAQVVNASALRGPLGTVKTCANATAKFVSDCRLDIAFSGASVALPEESEATATIPSALTPAVSPLYGAATAAADALSSALGGGAASGSAPELRLSIDQSANSPGNSTWLVNTFVDGEVRVSRGDGGGVFVLVREDEVEAEEDGTTTD